MEFIFKIVVGVRSRNWLFFHEFCHFPGYDIYVGLTMNQDTLQTDSITDFIQEPEGRLTANRLNYDTLAHVFKFLTVIDH